jgi:hypothetical protein
MRCFVITTLAMTAMVYAMVDIGLHLVQSLNPLQAKPSISPTTPNPT